MRYPGKKIFYHFLTACEEEKYLYVNQLFFNVFCMQSYTVGFGAFATVCVCHQWNQVAKASLLKSAGIIPCYCIGFHIFPDQNRIQTQLRGFLNKIKGQEIRNKVAVWQRYLANASSRLRFDSFSSVDDSSASTSSVIGSNNTDTGDENLAVNDVRTPSDSGTCIFIAPRPDQMEEVITNGERKEEVKLLHSPEEAVPRNKSPVQQWVDSLPLEETIIDKVEEQSAPVLEPSIEQEVTDAEVEGFTLGAEAVGVASPRPYPFVHVTNTCGGSDAGSHCSSMESLLESRKPDPEEVLLELGFGGVEESDTVSRIPARFLQPSALKGVAIEEFLKHQQLLVHTYESGFSGYRGLAGPFNTIPSGIVGKIMERLREAEVGRNNLHHRHNHISHYHKLNQSVLSPDNRKWLERQGVSPEPEGRRIVLGEKTFTFAKDGHLIEGAFERNGLKIINDKTEDKIKEPKGTMEVEKKTGTYELNEGDRRPQSAPMELQRHSSLEAEQLEMEYKTIALLANQLKGSDIPLDFVAEDTFYKLTLEERKQIERGLIENALYTYQRRLRELDLRCHLKEFLSSQADKVSSFLGNRDQEWTNIIRQMTTLLRHQETLRQTLRLARNGYGNS